MSREWRPIETAPKGDEPILLACFRCGELVWACAGHWNVWMPSTIQCASAQGWYPMLPLIQPNLSRERYELHDGRIGGDYPPTHWQLLSEPPNIPPE